MKTVKTTKKTQRTKETRVAKTMGMNQTMETMKVAQMIKITEIPQPMKGKKVKMRRKPQTTLIHRPVIAGRVTMASLLLLVLALRVHRALPLLNLTR